MNLWNTLTGFVLTKVYKVVHIHVHKQIYMDIEKENVESSSQND